MNPELRALFNAGPGYLNTASLGLPPETALVVLGDLLDRWRRGVIQPPDFDEAITRSRAAWARLSGLDPSCVATGSTVSQFVGLVAQALPDGARVVTAQGEFTSVTFPFLAHADRGVRVEEVPLAALADVRGRVDLIAVSAVQSADGRMVDLARLLRTAQETGARLLLDTTQSCGWLPLDCGQVDYVVCGGYKWLLSPRGTAYLGVRADRLDGLRPLAAGWYAGDDPWTSIYGSPLRLAADARRLDLSPAWFSWSGAAVAVELLAGLEPGAVRDHNVTLADRFLARMGEPPQGSAIVSVPVAHPVGTAERLTAAGVRTAVRAGRIRASFHLYNGDEDVDLAASTLGY